MEKPADKNSKSLQKDTCIGNEKSDAQHKRSGDVHARVMKTLLVNRTRLMLRVVEVVAVDVRDKRQGAHHRRGKSHRDDQGRKNFLHALNLNKGHPVCQINLPAVLDITICDFQFLILSLLFPT